MELLFGFFGIFPLLIIALIVFMVASAATGRREPDPTGRRPYGVYLAIVSFMSLFVLLFSATFAIASVGEIVLDPEFGTERAGGAVLSGLIALAAALVLLFHGRRLRGLSGDRDTIDGTGRSTYHVYLYAVCLLTVLTAFVTAALAVFALLNLVAPSVVDGDSEGASSQLITTGFLAVASLWIFVWHWRRAAALRGSPVQEPGPEAAPPV